MMLGKTQLTRHAIAASILLTALACPTSGQVMSRKNSWGIFLRPGLTKGLNSNSNGLSDQNYLTGGMGVYDLIRIRNSPARIPFYFIKAELGFNNRTGLFDVQGAGAVLINSHVVDLSIVLPLSVEISETLRANASVGASLGYLTSTEAEDVTGATLPISGSTWRPGFVFDVGFVMDAKSSAILGLRTLVESGNYACTEFGFYLGFGFSRKKT